MSLLSRLFGSKSNGDAKPSTASVVEYEGFRITPNPAKEAQGYRLAAMIEKDVNGEIKSHQLIRADTISDFDVCVEASVAKAKQMIDQMGERLF